MLLMHHMDHLSPADSESGAGGNRSSCGQTQSSNCRERLLPYKVAGYKEHDGSFLPGGGNNCDLCAAFLKIKNRICGIALRKEGILWRQSDDSSPQASARQKCRGIESWLLAFNH